MGKRPRRCGHVARAAERRVGEGEGKGGRPLAQCPAPARLPPASVSLWAKCRAQRRKCTRQTPLLPVRSPRVSPPTAEPLPAYGRSAERRVGEGEGKGGRPLAQQPALSPPTAESLCAKAEVHKAIPAPARAFSPLQLAYGRAPAR